jgi:hypothetical protein
MSAAQGLQAASGLAICVLREKNRDFPRENQGSGRKTSVISIRLVHLSQSEI